jgi:hypothetical protein
MQGPERMNFLIMLAVASEFVEQARLEDEPIHIQDTGRQSYLKFIINKKILPKYQLMLDSQVFKDEGDMGFCEDY